MISVQINPITSKKHLLKILILFHYVTLNWIHKSFRNHIKLHHYYNNIIVNYCNIIILSTIVIFLASDQKSVMLLYSAVEQLCAALSCREMGGAMCPIRRPCHNVYYQHHKYIPQGCQQPSVLAMVYGSKLKDHTNLILLSHLHYSIKTFQLHPRKYQHKKLECYYQYL